MQIKTTMRYYYMNTRTAKIKKCSQWEQEHGQSAAPTLSMGMYQTMSESFWKNQVSHNFFFMVSILSLSDKLFILRQIHSMSTYNMYSDSFVCNSPGFISQCHYILIWPKLGGFILSQFRRSEVQPPSVAETKVLVWWVCVDTLGSSLVLLFQPPVLPAS